MPRSNLPRRPIRPLPWWAGLGVLILVGTATFLVYQWMSQSSGPKGTAESRLHVDIIRSALTAGAGIGALAALYLAFRRQQHNEHHDTEQRVADLRIRAAEQLGSDRTVVRISGLNNLEQIAHQHPALRQVIVNEVCAYLRMPYVPPSADAENDGEDETAGTAKSRVRDEELEVRLTAQRVLRRVLANQGGDGDWSVLPLRRRQERRARFVSVDLVGAYLYRFDLSGALLHDGDFTEATFDGDMTFEKATFDGKAVFTDITVGGQANFMESKFHGVANFARAQFESNSHFAFGKFNANALFEDARFAGRASFNRSTFQYATFQRAAFDAGAAFDSVTFRYVARFNETVIRSKTHFANARFRDDVRFDGAAFESMSDFVETRFDKLAAFYNANFNGPVHFRRATFGWTAGFSFVQFRLDVLFSGARFHEVANFTSAVFGGNTRFDHTSIRTGALFPAAEFKHGVKFNGANLPRDTSFGCATFHGCTTFTRVRFDQLPVDATPVELLDSARAVLEPEDHLWPPGWRLVPDPENPGYGVLSADGEVRTNQDNERRA